MYRKLLAIVGAGLAVSVPAIAQVTDDFLIDVAVTAEPQITITNAANDVSFTSDGSTLSPSTGVAAILCFETSLSDIRVGVSLQNQILNSFPALTNKDVDDYFNYSLSGGIGGGNSVDWGVIETQDFDLTSANTGAANCSANSYLLLLLVEPTVTPGGNGRSIPEAVADSGLDDGTTYTFSDIVTVTLEPLL